MHSASEWTHGSMEFWKLFSNCRTCWVYLNCLSESLETSFTKKISNTIDRIYHIIKRRFFWMASFADRRFKWSIHFKRCYWYEHRKVPLLYFLTSSLVLLYSWHFQINRTSNWVFNEIQVNFSIQPISMRCTSLNVLNYQSTQCRRIVNAKYTLVH